MTTLSIYTAFSLGIRTYPIREYEYLSRLEAILALLNP